MKKKIKTRFMLLSAAGILITAAVSMFLFYEVLVGQIFSDLRDYMMVVKEIDLKTQLPENSSFRVTRIDTDGTVLFDNQADVSKMDNHKDRPEVKLAMSQGEGESIRYSHTLLKHTLYYAQELDDGTVLRVAKTTESITLVVKNTIGLILLLAFATFLGSVLIAHLLTKKMVEPIEKMAESILVIDTNEVYDEIRPFINTIKEQHMDILMHGKLRQEFTANVSHELKTPLTSISGYAELIENGMVNEEDTKRFANQIQKNARRLLSLINDIIKLSELDDTETSVSFEQLDLYQLAGSCLSMLEINASRMDVTLHLDGEPAMMQGNRSLLEELILNLCTNGIRYNEHGGKVWVSVKVQNDHVQLIVEDTGIGIPQDQQERVFERFYRVDKSRSKRTGGTGLGLAIVKHVVAAHEGSITLFSQPGKGTRITVEFPVAPMS